MERQTMVWSGQSREQAQPRPAGVGVLKAQLERALTMTAAASPGSCPRPWGCLCIARRSCFWGCGWPAPCPKLWGGVRNGQGVRLPWTGERGEAKVARCWALSATFFIFCKRASLHPLWEECLCFSSTRICPSGSLNNRAGSSPLRRTQHWDAPSMAWPVCSPG